MNHEFYIDQAKACMHVFDKNDQSQMTKHELIKSHLMLVVKIAGKYSGYNVDIEDLISQGNIGLIKAADKFDRSKGTFAAIARNYIKGEMLEYIMRNNGQVAIKRGVGSREEFFSSKKSNSKIASVVVNCKTNNNVNAYDNESTMHGGFDYTNNVDKDNVLSKIKSVLNGFSEKEKDIINHRYFHEGPFPKKYLAEKHGIKETYVDTLVYRTIDKLKKELTA